MQKTLSAPEGDSLIGKRYGQRVIIGFVETRGMQRRVLVRCDCGNENAAWLNDLNRGHGMSCRACCKNQHKPKPAPSINYPGNIDTNELVIGDAVIFRIARLLRDRRRHSPSVYQATTVGVWVIRSTWRNGRVDLERGSTAILNVPRDWLLGASPPPSSS